MKGNGKFFVVNNIKVLNIMRSLYYIYILIIQKIWKNNLRYFNLNKYIKKTFRKCILGIKTFNIIGIKKHIKPIFNFKHEQKSV